MAPLDIAVAGCGPAGLCAAYLLRRDGHRVRLCDQFDAPRPIGSGLMLQPTGLAVLAKLGLAQAAIAAGARIDRLFGLVQPSGRKVLDVRYEWLGGGHFGVGIHRAALFDLLYQAVAEAEVPIETSRVVAGSETAAGGRRLVFEDGTRSDAFDLIVDCLGADSPLSSPGRPLAYGALWASLDWPADGAFDAAALEQRYRRANRMVGVLPIGGFAGSTRPQAAYFWLLRGDGYERWLDGGLESWKADALALWPETGPLLDQIDRPERLTFARYQHRTHSAPAEPALIHIGDSWHSTSPQLGQGANMALLDAWALALALRTERDVPDALARAVAMRRRHVRLFQMMSALFTPAYQSDSRALPFLRDRIVGPLSWIWPATTIQAAMVSGLFGNPLAPLGLERR